MPGEMEKLIKHFVLTGISSKKAFAGTPIRVAKKE